MTFSEYIISERSENFYLISLGQIVKCKSTLEEWFSSMYYDWNLLHMNENMNTRFVIVEKQKS